MSFEHTVVDAPSGKEVLERLGDSEPAFILTDYRLTGGQTGLDVVAAVRAKFGEGVPAAVLTGDTDPGELGKIAAYGVTVLRKPIGLDILDATLSQHRARQRFV